MSKILIFDDHIAFRKGLNMMLQEIPEVECVKEVSDNDQFLNILSNFSPDLVLIDIKMPFASGLDTVILTLKKNPNLNIIILSMFGEVKYIKNVVNAGAKGFLLKPPSLTQLKDAYYTVMNGECFFPIEHGFITKH